MTMAGSLPPLTAEEKRVIAILVPTTALWLTDFWHGLQPAIPALLAAVLLTSPQIGILSWEGKAGTDHPLVHLLRRRRVPLAGQSPIPHGGGRLVRGLSCCSLPLFKGHSAVILLRSSWSPSSISGIANMSACIALGSPSPPRSPPLLQMNPVVFGLIVGIVVDAVILYPVQTATNLLAYETGLIQGKDVLKVGLGMLVITSLVILFIALPWWSLLDLPLTIK